MSKYKREEIAGGMGVDAGEEDENQSKSNNGSEKEF